MTFIVMHEDGSRRGVKVETVGLGSGVVVGGGWGVDGVGGMGVCGWVSGVWDGKVWVWVLVSVGGRWPVGGGISATEAGEPGGMIVDCVETNCRYTKKAH